jgi:hypothetical protein
LRAGDAVYLGSFGTGTIAGEMTGTYAGADRRVVYSNLTLESRYEFYWDKQTGVLIEGIMILGSAFKRVSITETNMWLGFDWRLLTIVLAVVACVILGVIVHVSGFWRKHHRRNA